MKSKTSITISRALLEALDDVLGKNGNRSELIEKALYEYLQKITREERDRRELEIINRHADDLNREALDALSYQVKL